MSHRPIAHARAGRGEAARDLATAAHLKMQIEVERHSQASQDTLSLVHPAGRLHLIGHSGTESELRLRTMLS